MSGAPETDADVVPAPGTPGVEAAAGGAGDGDGEDLRRPRLTHLAAYGSGSLGMGVWVTVPGLLLLYFLTDVLAVPALVAGFTLLLPKVVDVLVHPWLGSLSDRAARRTGHRRDLMRGGLLLGVAMVLVFTVPASLSGWSAAVWVGGWYVVGNLLFATFQVPYLTTPSDLRVGYHERTRVFMVRMLVLTVGLLVAGVAAPALVADGERRSYTWMAVTLGTLMLVTAAVAVSGVRRLTDSVGVHTPDAGHSHPTLAGIRVSLRDRDFRNLLISYLLTGAVTHLFLAALPYYSAYVFGRPRLTSLFMGLFLGPALVAGPAWLVVSRRTGKQRGLLVCQTTFVVGSLALAFGSRLGLLGTAAIVLVLGVAFAGLQLFAFSMVPDAVAAAQARGSSRAGAYTGAWTATEATGTAVGPYVYAAVLALGGFVSSSGPTVAQPDSAVSALVVGFTVVPAALMTVAITFQRRWTLDAARDRVSG